jgi:hypothetical protein
MSDEQAARIIVLSGKRKGEDVIIPRGSATMGRTRDADLVVKDKSISRIHARFDYDGRSYMVRDLGSKNGLRVNGRKVSEFTLHSGDMLYLGNIKMKFIDPTEMAEPPPPQGGSNFPLPAPPAPVVPAAPDPASPAGPDVGGLAADGKVDRYVPPGERGEAPPKGASAFAAPEAFFTPDPEMPEEMAPQATIRTLLPYIVVIVIASVGLAMLVWQTFREKYEPFQEDVSVAVNEVKLLDLVHHNRLLRGTRGRLRSSRICSVTLNRASSVLRVKGLSFGDTEYCFVRGEENELVGTVRVLVLEPQSRDVEDYSMYGDEELLAMAANLMREGDSLGETHLADAILKYDEAVKIFNLLPEGSAGKDEGIRKSMEFHEEREKRFAAYKNELKKATSLSHRSKALAILARIMTLYPDSSDENHQQARIFFDRMKKIKSGKKKKKR